MDNKWIQPILKFYASILDKLKLPTLKTLTISDKDTTETAHGKEEFDHDASVSTGIHLNKLHINSLVGDNMSTYSGITGVCAQSGATHGTGITGVSSILPINI